MKEFTAKEKLEIINSRLQYLHSTKVLFICKGNMFRSQMAEAIYNNMTNSRDAVSAGTYTGAPDEPEGRVLSDLLTSDSTQFKILEEHGMNIRNNRTKRLTPQMLDHADIVISMAEEPFIPDFLRNSKKVIWWSIDNPNNATPEFITETYGRLNELIEELIEKQGLHVTPEKKKAT